MLYLRRPGGQSQFSAVLAREARACSPIRAVQSWILEHLKEDLHCMRLIAGGQWRDVSGTAAYRAVCEK